MLSKCWVFVQLKENFQKPSCAFGNHCGHFLLESFHDISMTTLNEIAWFKFWLNQYASE